MRHLNMIYNGNTLYFVALKFFKARLKRVIIANPLSSGQVISVKLSIRNTHWHSKKTTTHVVFPYYDFHFRLSSCRIYDNERRIGSRHSVSSAVGFCVSQGFLEVNLRFSDIGTHWHELFGNHVD